MGAQKKDPHRSAGADLLFNTIDCSVTALLGGQKGGYGALDGGSTATAVRHYGARAWLIRFRMPSKWPLSRWAARTLSPLATAS